MIRVRSEIGRLRRALLHEPGLEVDRMVPSMMEQLLFDDILYGEAAREEHGRYRRVLQLAGVETIEAADLLAEALATDGAREWVADVLLADLESDYRDELRALPAAELVTILVAGARRAGGGSGIEVEELFCIPPLPNWCFQRDPQVILDDGVVFCSMAAPARHREALLSRVIFRHHPDYREVPVLFDPLRSEHAAYSGRRPPCLEGGDLLVLSADVVAVGLSERTNRNGIRQLARALARRESGPRWLVVAELPRRRAYMHLDTLITVVDRDACLVHAPVVLPGGAESLRIHEIDLHRKEPDFDAVEGCLLPRLAAHGVDLEPISCGGEDPVDQHREQWTDGANAMALAPGTITLFDRNLATAEELDRRGFEIVAAEDLLLGRAEIDVDGGGRTCILVPSHEISRARGGPHCLTHPLLRDDA